MNLHSKTYSVYGTLVRSTERAMLIQIHSFKELNKAQSEPILHPTDANPEWFPKAQILDYQILDNEDTLDEFIVKHWIMSEKGLV